MFPDFSTGRNICFVFIGWTIPAGAVILSGRKCTAVVCTAERIFCGKLYSSSEKIRRLHRPCGRQPQPGQTLIINCCLEAAPLARLCVRSAYEAGARDVLVNWSDNDVSRSRMEPGQRGSPDRLQILSGSAAISTTPRARAASASSTSLPTTPRSTPVWTAQRSAV